MTYDALRQFADSWGLVLMAVSFLTFIGWAFRPGSTDISSEAANMIFKEDDNG